MLRGACRAIVRQSLVGAGDALSSLSFSVLRLRRCGYAGVRGTLPDRRRTVYESLSVQCPDHETRFCREENR